MKITWIGHSCFRIEKDGCSVIIDPYQDGSVPGLRPVREKADLVLCSHEHRDHSFREGVIVKGSRKNPFVIEKLDTYHDDVRGEKRGRNTMFILGDGENRIAHLGDLGCMPEPEQLERLTGLDVVLIPVGGHYTIDGSQAADLVSRIAPGTVIPMHFRNDGDGFGFPEIGPVEEFTGKLDSVTTLASSEIETENNQAAKVVILQPKNKIS